MNYIDYDNLSESLKKKTIAFYEICRYQKDEKKRYKDVMFEHEDFLISKMKFVRLVRKIM